VPDLLRPVPGAGDAAVHAPLLPGLHLPLLEGVPGAGGLRQLPALPPGVRLQAVPHQLPGDGPGGQGPSGLHVRQLHPKHRGEGIGGFFFNSMYLV